MKLVGALFAVLLVACGGSSATTSSNSSGPVATQPSTSAPVIAALKTHDGKVSIVGGGKELRVFVTKDDGTVVADNVTLDELRTKDPESWALVKSSVASNGTYLDATLTDSPAPALK